MHTLILSYFSLNQILQSYDISLIQVGFHNFDIFEQRPRPMEWLELLHSDKLAKVEFLDVSKCSMSITTEVLKSIIQNCPLIETLNLGILNFVIAIEAFHFSVKPLETLRFNGQRIEEMTSLDLTRCKW